MGQIWINFAWRNIIIVILPDVINLTPEIF